MRKNAFAAGALPPDCNRELTALPRTLFRLKMFCESGPRSIVWTEKTVCALFSLCVIIHFSHQILRKADPNVILPRFRRANSKQCQYLQTLSRPVIACLIRHQRRAVVTMHHHHHQQQQQHQRGHRCNEQ